jgi:hypothetical protein
MVAALTLFLNAIPAQSQDTLKYVFIPTDELFINWDKIWSARHRLPQTPAVHAYANTTNEVLQAWCHDINFQRDAMAITTTPIMNSVNRLCTWFRFDQHVVGASCKTPERSKLPRASAVRASTI